MSLPLAQFAAIDNSENAGCDITHKLRVAEQRLAYIHATLLRDDLTAAQKCIAAGVTLHADENFENAAPGNRLLGIYASLRTEQAVSEAIKACKDRGVFANRDPRRGYARVMRIDSITAAVEALPARLERYQTKFRKADPTGLRKDGRYVEEYPSPTVPVPSQGTPVQVPQPDRGTHAQVPQLNQGTLNQGTPVEQGYPQPLEIDARIDSASARGLESNNSSRVESSSTVENNNNPQPRAKRSAADRGSRLPVDWTLPTEWGRWAVETFDVRPSQVRAEAVRFRDYWHGVAGQNARKVDWFATWRNWCGNERRAWPRRKPIEDMPLPPDLPKPMTDYERSLQEAREAQLAYRRRFEKKPEAK